MFKLLQAKIILNYGGTTSFLLYFLTAQQVKVILGQVKTSPPEPLVYPGCVRSKISVRTGEVYFKLE